MPAMRNPNAPSPDRAVTLTELLLVVLIIGLLSTMAIPVAVNRSNQAKTNTARAEVKVLADAEASVALTHGFYVPLQMLDDIPVDPSTRILGRTDDVQNEANVFLIDAHENPLDQRNRGQLRLLSGRITDLRVRDLFEQWQGPFAQFTRVFISTGTGTDTTGGDEFDSTRTRLDYPMDPWGNPYYFYSPEGVVGSLAGSIAQGQTRPTDFQLGSTSWGDGLLTRLDRRFDRFAVVSFGPDGVSDRTAIAGSSSTGLPLRGDDIVYLFGTVVPALSTRLPAGETAF